jgi:hypothetical protein
VRVHGTAPDRIEERGALLRAEQRASIEAGLRALDRRQIEAGRVVETARLERVERRGIESRRIAKGARAEGIERGGVEPRRVFATEGPSASSAPGSRPGSFASSLIGRGTP